MNFRNNFPQSGRFNGSTNCGGYSSDRQKYKGNFAAYNQQPSVNRPSMSEQSNRGFEAPNVRRNFNNNNSFYEANKRGCSDNYSQGYLKKVSWDQPQGSFSGGSAPAIYNQQGLDFSRGNVRKSRVYNNHYVIPDRATRRSFYNDPSLDGPEVEYYNYDAQYLPSEVRAKRRGNSQRVNRSRFFTNLAARRSRGEYGEEEFDDRESLPERSSIRRVERDRRRPVDYSREVEEDQYYDDEDGYSDDYYEERRPSRGRKVAKRPVSSDDDYDDYGDECGDEEELPSRSSRGMGKSRKPAKRMICREEDDDDYEEEPVAKPSPVNFFKKKTRQ